MRQALPLLSVIFLVACGGSVGTSDPSSASTPDDTTADQRPGAPGASDNAAPPKAPEPTPPPTIGGPCLYDEVTGIATVSEITLPGKLDDACANDGRVVKYTFTPDDPAAPPVPPAWKIYDEGNRRLLRGSKSPANACLVELGIEIGTTFPAKRRLGTSGSCSPIVYEVQTSLASCTSPCR